MIEFGSKLEEHLLALAPTWVGAGTHPQHTVKLFDDHLYDVAVEQTPFLVITARISESESGEIGNEHDLHTWNIHIYYIAIDANYTNGKVKRSNILSRIEKALEENRRLNNFSVTEGSNREYVYDHKVQTVTFDSSGQEEYFTFVSEFYLDVYTARN